MSTYLQIQIQQTTPDISYKLKADIAASSPGVVSFNPFGASLPAEQYQIEYRTKNKIVNLPIKFVAIPNGIASK